MLRLPKTSDHTTNTKTPRLNILKYSYWIRVEENKIISLTSIWFPLLFEEWHQNVQSKKNFANSTKRGKIRINVFRCRNVSIWFYTYIVLGISSMQFLLNLWVEITYGSHIKKSSFNLRILLLFKFRCLNLDLTFTQEWGTDFNGHRNRHYVRNFRRSYDSICTLHKQLEKNVSRLFLFYKKLLTLKNPGRKRCSILCGPHEWMDIFVPVNQY